MAYERRSNVPTFIMLCMEIAELVGMLSPRAQSTTRRRRELRSRRSTSLVIEGNKLDERGEDGRIWALLDRRDIRSRNARRLRPIPELDPHSLRICRALTA